jgi:hypothetical protein
MSFRCPHCNALVMSLKDNCPVCHKPLVGVSEISDAKRWYQRYKDCGILNYL